MSLVLGQNPSNELKPIELTAAGLLKVEVDSGGSGVGVDLEKVGGSAISLGNNTNANSIPVSLSSDGNQATASLQTSGNTSLATLAGAVSGTEFQCDVVTSALPTGAATSALQTSGNTSLSTIDSKITQGYDAQVASGGNGLQQNLCYGLDTGGNLDALRVDASGHLEVTIDDFVKSQATMANSFPVVIASDQSAISVSSAGGNTTNANETLTPGSGGTGNSTAQDMNGFSQLTIFGNSTNVTDSIKLQISHNGSTWYDDQAHFVSQNSSGDFVVYVENSGARYYRITQTDTQTTAYTMVINSSKK